MANANPLSRRRKWDCCGRALLACALTGLVGLSSAQDKPEESKPVAEEENSEASAGGVASAEAKATELYPSLDDRELGQPVIDATGGAVTYDRALPFFGQKVVDLGIDLPNPYGVTLTGVRIRQDLLISDLEISIGGSPPQQIDFVQFDVAEADNLSAQIRGDLWLLPFMNVYAIAGRIDGDATVPLGFPVDDALDFLGLGALCPPGPVPPRPAFCDEIVTAVAEPDYEGYNVGLGTVLAFGWKRFFTVLPITYVYSNLDLIDSNIDTLTVSPRFGFTLNPKRRHRVALFVGATYLDASFDIVSSVVLPLSQVDPSLEDVEIDYKIRQDNKDKWNYLLGLNYELKKAWSVQAEVGFGGSREDVIVSGGYRW